MKRFCRFKCVIQIIVTITPCYKLNSFNVNNSVFFYNSAGTLMLVYVLVVTKAVLFGALISLEYRPNSAFIRNNFNSRYFI